MVNYDPLATDPVVLSIDRNKETVETERTIDYYLLYFHVCYTMTDRELGKYLRFGFRFRSFCISMK